MNYIDPKILTAAAYLYNDVVDQLRQGGWTPADEAADPMYLWRHPRVSGTCTMGAALRYQHCWDLETVASYIADEARVALAERRDHTADETIQAFLNAALAKAATAWDESRGKLG